MNSLAKVLNGAPADSDRRGKSGWRLAQGEEIVPGRQVVRRLGGGTRYDVYLAIDDRLHALVVAKLLKPQHLDEERALRQLGREAETLARLAHPGIVRMFSAVVAGPRPHLVLEHIEGPTLRALLRRYGPLPPEQLLPLAVNLCSVLHYLASEECVHLDVKPANIVMSAPPRLIDFSVARSVERATRLRKPVGTRTYMAPEQCEPGTRGEITPAADIWGLGVTLYEAMTGTNPFAGYDGEFPQMLRAPAPLPRAVPRRVADVVLECLRPNPSQRPTAYEVARALEPLVAALPLRPPLGRRRPRLGSR